jgi:hypothetical protein
VDLKMSASSYILPYSILLKQVGVANGADNSDRVELTRDQLLSLIRGLLGAVSVDEAWYKTIYQDVEQAIQSGSVGSAKEHFVSNGYFEGRLPSKVVVDEAFYISKYPDVAEGIGDGEINSAQEHFETHGFSEGRLPFER